MMPQNLCQHLEIKYAHLKDKSVDSLKINRINWPPKLKCFESNLTRLKVKPIHGPP